MSRSRPRLRSRIKAGLVIAALVLGATTLLAPASAESQEAFYSLQSGNLSIGEQAFDLPPGGGFNGTYDDETGELSGEFVFPVIEAPLDEPLPVVIFASLSQAGPATGSIDPDTGAADLAVTLNLGLEIRTAAGATLVGAPCGIGPIPLALTGSFDPTTAILELAQQGFTLPSATGCGPLFTDPINEILGGPTSVLLRLLSADGPIAPPPGPGGPTDPGEPTTEVEVPISMEIVEPGAPQPQPQPQPVQTGTGTGAGPTPGAQAPTRTAADPAPSADARVTEPRVTG